MTDTEKVNHLKSAIPESIKALREGMELAESQSDQKITIGYAGGIVLLESILEVLNSD